MSVVAPVVAAAPGGTAVGEGTVEEEGAGVVGDLGRMTDEEEEGVVAVVLVMVGVVIQE